ncbi:hypothetical protein SAMN06265371_102304 [Lutibacter agarilyticus]|uniref:Nicotinic acid mononucleotide adenyltransferase n=1 Tax=Lutibacter agarilyticus TaxID=1109740 RepID=A0A238W0S3_9FLAO|nr:hypothetical protein [Lutibacter agarilyticus]SNR39964.1 hypothetical protein SAMN06265371_102304 [Lutibacter agarilyticus]
MKSIKLLFVTIITALTIASCSLSNEPIYYPPTLEEIVTGYDLWYVDYNRTTGPGNVPFLSMAFTISFRNGYLYANNNIVGLGFTGNGYGIEIGRYDTYNGFLEVDHIIDGYYDFDVVEISSTSIKLVDNRNRVTYYLEGYQKRDFDYDKVFYDNIEYFLQEYQGWEKTDVIGGEPNDFDYENFLYFSQDDITIFGSSIDEIGTDIGNVIWDYEGIYEVFNVTGYDDLKILTLDYDFNVTEEFELSVINDEVISLYHNASGTTYEFTGRGFIQYLKPDGKIKTDAVRIDGRERTKVERKTKVRKNRK